MRVEVHVHGTVQLRGGVSLAQVEAALQPWLDYLDVENVDECKSVHRDEPGIVFEGRRRLIEICWTGDVGRNFRKVIEESMQALGRYCEYAAEIQLSFYHEDGRDEIGIVFVGPDSESVREAQRRRMVEDISNLLSRHFDQQEISEVVSHINEMFARHWAQRGGTAEQEIVTEPQPAGGRGRKHLH
jgi:phenylpyruvate tautomerase PptA (4-oxalocrotonate tautomerase family)